MKRHIYIEQFNGFWRLTTHEWREVCQKAINEEGYNLNLYTPLVSKPSWIHHYRDSDRAHDFWWQHDTHLFYQPLDWKKENFQDAIKELDKLEGKNSE